MRISAHIKNVQNDHVISLQTNDEVNSVNIPPKSTGFGSSVNGGELLFLALATCYCNDIYREAQKDRIKIISVEVTVNGDFGGPGEPATNVTYDAKVCAHANENEIINLMNRTDKLAEIQNTLRIGTQVVLNKLEVISV